MSIDAASAGSARPAAARGISGRPLMLLAAPAAAGAAGIAAEWLDFRALRYPLLLMVLAAVVITAIAIEQRAATRTMPNAKQSLRTIALGIAAWCAAEALYVAIHTVRGEPFDAERFGPQWAQALGLIAVHAAVLGAPTGAAAAAILRARSWRLARD